MLALEISQSVIDMGPAPLLEHYIIHRYVETPVARTQGAPHASSLHVCDPESSP